MSPAWPQPWSCSTWSAGPCWARRSGITSTSHRPSCSAWGRGCSPTRSVSVMPSTRTTSLPSTTPPGSWSARERPLGVGFSFSLGHSSVVLVLAVLLNFGIRALNMQVSQQSSGLHSTTNIIGTSISGTFLYLIALVNLVVLVSIVKLYRQMRSGRYDAAELGATARQAGPHESPAGATPATSTPRGRCIPSGSSSASGSTPRTEVGLIVLAGSAVVGGLPFYPPFPVPARALCGRHVPLRHARRLLHELRLRLGLRQPGAQGLLQPDDHGVVSCRRVPRRDHRDPRPGGAGDQFRARPSGISSGASTSIPPAS